MKKIIAQLNKKQMFHTFTASGAVEVMPVQMDAEGKALLQKYFNFGPGDFTVPTKMKDPFMNKASELIKQKANEQRSKASQKQELVNKGY